MKDIIYKGVRIEKVKYTYFDKETETKKTEYRYQGYINENNDNEFNIPVMLFCLISSFVILLNMLNNGKILFFKLIVVLSFAIVGIYFSYKIINSTYERIPYDKAYYCKSLKGIKNYIDLNVVER